MNSITSEEILELEKRVYLFEDKIIKYDELEDTSPEKISVMWKKIGELIPQGQKICVLANLVDANPPNASVREQIRIEQEKIKDKICHFAIFTGKNKLINLSIKFVMGKGFLKSISISKTENDAYNEIQKHIS